MIRECKKQDGCWTNIGSPDFGQEQQLRGYLENRVHGLSNLTDSKKNGLWLLWGGLSQLLRPKGTDGQGFVVRRKTGLFGDGNSQGYVLEMREGETGEIAVAGGQYLLHQTVCFFGWTEVSVNAHPECRGGRAPRLEDGKGDGYVVHAGAAASSQESQAGGHRDRRDIDQERARISNSGQRFRTGTANLVWRQRSFRGKHESVLSMVRREKELKNQAGSYGYVEGLRKVNAEECSKCGHSLRQISCDKTSWRSAGQDTETGIRASFRQGSEIYQGAEVGLVIKQGEFDAGRQGFAEGAYESEQTTQHRLLAQGILRTIVGLSNGRLGKKILRQLERIFEMAKIKALRGLCKTDRTALGWDSSLQQTGEQSSSGFCGRAQQQDQGNSAESVWLKGRGVFAFEGANLYAGGDLN